MLAQRMRRMALLMFCSSILLCGGVAFGDNKCGEKCGEKAECPKAKKCGFCSWLSGKCDTCKQAEAKVKKCGLCDKLAGKCDKCSTNGSQAAMTSDLPPNAVAGECYAKGFIPATYKTVTERIMTQEASERIEVIPATFKWVEERVMVKACSTQLEATPAEYKWTERTIEVAPAHTGWVMQSAEDCANPENKARGDIFCLRTTPPVYKTIRTQCLVKPACVRSVTIPAEYQTIRRQVVDCPATTRKVCIPAQYEDIQKTVMVCPERVKWEHIVCEEKLTSEAVNKVKTSLLASGYKPGPLDGKLGREDWAALSDFQQKNGLGVGKLSYDTLSKLGVSLQ